MELKLDMECIQMMNFFENFTGAKVKDCLIKDGFVYFLTRENDAHRAIGRNGSTVKRLEERLGKTVKIFEYSPDNEAFVRNMIPKASEIRLSGPDDSITADVKVNKPDRYFIIGRDSRNLNIIKEILQRNSNIREVNIR